MCVHTHIGQLCSVRHLGSSLLTSATSTKYSLSKEIGLVVDHPISFLSTRDCRPGYRPPDNLRTSAAVSKRRTPHGSRNFPHTSAAVSKRRAPQGSRNLPTLLHPNEEHNGTQSAYRHLYSSANAAGRIRDWQDPIGTPCTDTQSPPVDLQPKEAGLTRGESQGTKVY
jgi:hypothetical protein